MSSSRSTAARSRAIRASSVSRIAGSVIECAARATNLDFALIERKTIAVLRKSLARIG
jgi:hypothetical protein